MSKEFNHFGVIAGLFWQIGGHSSRIVLFCFFWRLFTIKMIKSVKVLPLSFWKIRTFFFTSLKSSSRHKHAKWLPSDLTTWTLTLLQPLTYHGYVVMENYLSKLFCNHFFANAMLSMTQWFQHQWQYECGPPCSSTLIRFFLEILKALEDY